MSVFGRGYGESICVHLGDGEWVVVDSCLNPQDSRPAALSYLESLGLDPSTCVKLIVVTHWDDDHIQGMGAVVSTCARADVACSAAIDNRSVMQFVIAQEGAKGASGSGLDELRSILRTCKARQSKVIWAKANLPLYPRPPSEPPAVAALSPSEDAAERSLVALIERATESTAAFRSRYRAPEKANGASVATVIRARGACVILGADLEVTANPAAGWAAVVSESAPGQRASFVKVPHHGSENAHYQDLWVTCVEDDAIAVLSPWTRGTHHLPTQADLDRISAVAGEVHLTAMPAPIRARPNAEVERMIRRLNPRRITSLSHYGQVRARKRQAETRWRVTLSGDAVTIGQSGSV